MKKLLSAIAVTAMMMLGLVAVSSGPASAACPYSACINTTTTVRAPASKRAHKSVPIKVSVTAPGNVTPTGNITVKVTKSNGHVVYNTTQPYGGGTSFFVTQGLRHGSYTAQATFVPTAGSVWNGSAAATTFTVKKQKRHHNH